MSNINELNSWHADWTQTKALVYGLGVTGFSVADTLVELGAEVKVVAASADEQQIDILGVIGVACSIGKSEEENLNLLREFAPDVLITSPGIKPDNYLIAAAANAGIPIWTDIDLARGVHDKWGIQS